MSTRPRQMKFLVLLFVLLIAGCDPPEKTGFECVPVVDAKPLMKIKVRKGNAFLYEAEIDGVVYLVTENGYGINLCPKVPAEAERPLREGALK